MVGSSSVVIDSTTVSGSGSLDVVATKLCIPTPSSMKASMFGCIQNL